MKKILLSCLAVFLLVIYGCSGNNTNKNNINEDAVDYKGNLVIQGVGPTISMEPVVDEGMLALRGDFEDHADHIFVPAGLWEDFFESANEYLPGNTVNFEGKIEFLDGAAGNHYYGVISIDKMDIVGYPDSDGIKNILDSYNYCEDDSDCTYIMGECPFGCFVAFNKKFENIPSNIIENYFDINGISCMYNCMYMNDVICENYKCTMTHNTDNDVVNTMCDPDSKSEDVMCTMIFDPVCGSDGTTYGNSCEACKSETVKSYTAGEC